MDVAAWLRGRREQYEQAFRENAIDADVLPELTDADLEKLGMLLGHRKRLLALSHPAWSKEDVSITGHAGTAPQSRAPWVWPAPCLRVRLRRPWLEMATRRFFDYCFVVDTDPVKNKSACSTVAFGALLSQYTRKREPSCLFTRSNEVGSPDVGKGVALSRS